MPDQRHEYRVLIAISIKVLCREDFSEIGNGVNAPYSFWLLGGADRDTYRAAEAARRLDSGLEGR